MNAAFLFEVERELTDLAYDIDLYPELSSEVERLQSIARKVAAEAELAKLRVSVA